MSSSENEHSKQHTDIVERGPKRAQIYAARLTTFDKVEVVNTLIKTSNRSEKTLQFYKFELQELYSGVQISLVSLTIGQFKVLFGSQTDIYLPYQNFDFFSNILNKKICCVYILSKLHIMTRAKTTHELLIINLERFSSLKNA